MADLLILLKIYRGYLAGAVAGLLVLVLLFSGCQGSDLEGIITHKDGVPVSWGTVTAVGPDNQVYSAPIQPDGSYRIHGLPRGIPVRITVSSPNPHPPTVSPSPAIAPTGHTGSAGSKARAAKGDGKRPLGVDPTTPQPPVPQPASPPANWFPIDGKYANPNTSGLNATPGRGKHHITVE